MLAISCGALLLGALSCVALATNPTAKVKNGTYVGVRSAEYKEDFFLGIPYAQPPVENLRWRQAKPLDTSWSGTRNAKKYSPECYGYGVRTPFNLGVTGTTFELVRGTH